MSFTFRCPHCNMELKAQEDWVGLETMCPNCARRISIFRETAGETPGIPLIAPPPQMPSPAKFEFSCPVCGGHMLADANSAGRQTSCPHCNRVIAIAEAPAVLHPDERLCPQCGGAVKKTDAFCRFCRFRLLSQSEFEYQNQPYASPQSGEFLEKMFFWWWLTAALGIPTCGFGFLASLVFFYILIYQYWCLIPPENAETTPGKAVGFLFIPFYSLYWGFIAIWGLGKAFHRETGNAGHAAAWSLAFAIVSCVAPVCNLVLPNGWQLLTLIVAFVPMIVMVIYFQQAARELIARKG